MLDVVKYISEIEKICDRNDVKRLTLFGSALREDFSDSSDVDFLLELKHSRNGLRRYMNIKEDLENVLGRPVDLVMPDALKNERLKKHIYQMTRDLYVA